MAPHLWPRDPAAVSRDFKERHGADRVYLLDRAGLTLTNSFMWAVWTAEGSDYLEKLDAAVYPRGHVPPGGPNPDLVDISHARWASANAITAIDLCAATIGHLFCGTPGPNELSLRDFRQKRDRARRRTLRNSPRTAVPPEFLKWVDETLADQRYKDLHGARNPFTHAWLRRHGFIGTAPPGHADRTQFEVLGTGHRINAREMVVDSASLALDRVRAFIDVVDGY
jgi:hypothetical protein